MYRFIFITFLLLSNLYSYTLPSTIYVLDYNSPNCYGSNESVKKNVVTARLQKDRGYVSDTPSSGQYYMDNKPMIHEGKTFLCSNKSYNFNYSDSLGDLNIVLFKSDNSSHNSIKANYTMWDRSTVEFPSDCKDLTGSTPNESVIDGYDFQSIERDIESCKSKYDQFGNGNGMTFTNPHNDTGNCKSGYCYYNTAPNCKDLTTVSPQSEMGGYAYQLITSDTSTCKNNSNVLGNGKGFNVSSPNANLVDCPKVFCYYNIDNENENGNGNNSNNNETNTSTGGGDKVTDLEELIPYIDELEAKNTEIINKLATNNTINESINESINDTNTNLRSMNSSINKLNRNIEVQNNRNSKLNNDLNNIRQPSETDITSDLANFTSSYKSTLNDSFSNYSDVFGLDGYGSPPRNVTFSLFGNTYTIFDISILSPFVDTIRNIFLISAYLFGIFTFFRS